MDINELLDALERLGIAQVSSLQANRTGTTYLLTGQLPAFPFRCRSTVYELTVPAHSPLLTRDHVDYILRYFWRCPLDTDDLIAVIAGASEDESDSSSG